MDYIVVMDSGCDLNEDIKEQIPLRIVPLRVVLGEHDFLDENVNLQNFLEKDETYSSGTAYCQSFTEWVS